MRRARISALAAFLVLSFLFVTACSGSSSSPSGSSTSQSPATSTASNSDGGEQELREIVFAVLPGASTNWLNIEIAVRKGLFEKNGLKPNIVQIESSTAMIAAVQAGNVDFGTTGPTVERSIMKGVNVMNYFHTANYAMWTYGLPEIDTPEKLRGKTLAYDTPTNADIVRQALRAKGLDPDNDLTMIQISDKSLFEEALKNGQVDAVTTNAAYGAALEEAGYANIMAVHGVLPIAYMWVFGAADKADKDPDMVKRLLHTLLDANDFIVNNREEAEEILADWMNLTPGAAKKALAAQLEVHTMNGMPNEAAFQLSIEQSKQDVGVTEDWPPEKLADFRLLQEVLQERNR